MSVAAGGRGRVPMLEVNPHVMCVLCGGYFIDATTIIECLHSFCRKCIVTYLESSRFCPICDVQVHKTKPLMSIRPDATLQDIVYKLVPGLYRDEMRRRREFYASRPASELPGERGEARGEERRAVFAPDELLVVRLQSQLPAEVAHRPAQVRYLRCPAQVTVGHLQHMLGCKHELPPGHRVELMARGEVLTSDLMLLDVAYLHCWRRVGPLQLFYRIVTVPLKRALPEADAEPAKLTAAERGCRDRLPNGETAPPAIIPAAPAPALQEAVAAPLVKEETDVKLEPLPMSDVKQEPETAVAVAGELGAEVGEVRVKRTDSVECKEVQLHISETGEMTFGNGPTGGGGAVDILQQACSILDSLETGEAGSELPPVALKASCETPPPVRPASPAPAGKEPIRDNNKNEIGRESRPPDDTGQKRPAKEPPPGRPRPRIDDGRKRSSPVGYKTLKTPPKSWNPQLPRSYVSSAQKSTEPGRTMSPIAPKPARRFFKRQASGADGLPSAQGTRAPLLMRLEPTGLPPAAMWGDQLSLYPHLYAAQPLSFLPGPAVSMFMPPPAHSGMSQLTYTSAPGSFAPLLTAPRPPAQRHLSPPVRSASANGGQKAALPAAAAGRSPPLVPPPPLLVSTGSSSPQVPSASSPAVERPHISCAVPISRPRPSERPPSAAPTPVPPAAATAATRLPLCSYLNQTTAPGPPGLLGAPFSPGPGGRPLANGQTPLGSGKGGGPHPLPPPPPPQGVAAVKSESSNGSGSRTKERPTPPPCASSGSGKSTPAPVQSSPVQTRLGSPSLARLGSPAQARPGPPASTQVKAVTETRPAPASTATAATGRVENTAVTRS